MSWQPRTLAEAITAAHAVNEARVMARGAQRLEGVDPLLYSLEMSYWRAADKFEKTSPSLTPKKRGKRG